MDRMDYPEVSLEQVRDILLALKPGQEVQIGGEMWLRMDRRTFKVHTAGQEPNDRNSAFYDAREIQALEFD